MYLEHFNLFEFPFTTSSNIKYFCNLSSHQYALNILLFTLGAGDGFIKITGKIGTGKTMLCQELINNISDKYTIIHISSPPRTPQELYKALAHELSISIDKNDELHNLQKIITKQLLSLSNSEKKVVLIIDEAQTMSEESLESLRLLCDLENASKKLLQIVLFGQPELDKKLAKKSLKQLKQRIAFSYRLNPISDTKELKNYVYHRLEKAGNKYTDIFSHQALNLLSKASAGIPRLINILCHKALMSAYGKGKRKVYFKEMLAAILDTESIPWKTKYLPFNFINWLILISILVLAFELINTLIARL